MRTDAQLIREAWDDPDAFAELYIRHCQSLYRWLRMRAPEPVAAEQTAEAFAQAALVLKPRGASRRPGAQPLVDHARATLRLVLVSPLLIRDQVWRRAAA